MDPNRFDDLTRILGSAVSRRHALKIALATGFGFMTGGMIETAQSALARAPGAGGRHSCASRRQGPDLVSRFSLDSAKKRTTLLSTTTLAPGGDRTESTIIKHAGTTLLRIDLTRPAAGNTEVRLGFGSAFHGIKHAKFTRNGKTMHGAIDGRRLAPFSVGTKPQSVRYADGRPAPLVRLPNNIGMAMTAVLDQGARQTQPCFRDLPRAAALSRATPFQTPPGFCTNPGHMSAPASSPPCVSCKSHCTAAGMACVYGAAAGCAVACAPFALFFGFGYGVCLAACIALADTVCVLNEVDCTTVCDQGAACCPVHCSVRCCDQDETCLDPATGYCCSPGLRPCGRRCCCEPRDTCADGLCCPESQIRCGNVCCVDAASCVDGACCLAPSRVCGKVCCPPHRQCCSNVCCETQDRCVGGVCCPPSRACGNICCPPGHVCLFLNGTATCSAGSPPPESAR
jgi:hypothetical protein